RRRLPEGHASGAVHRRQAPGARTGTVNSNSAPAQETSSMPVAAPGPVQADPFASGAQMPTATVAVAGLGAVGLQVATALDRGIRGLRLTAVSARNRSRAEASMASF